MIYLDVLERHVTQGLALEGIGFGEKGYG